MAPELNIEDKVTAALTDSSVSSDANDIGEGTVTEDAPEPISSEANDIGEGTVTEDEEMSGPPSFANYLKYATDQALNNASAASAFPEDTDPALTQALDQSDPMKAKLSSLGKMSAEERAKTGAAVGAMAGATYMGKDGAVVGGSIGAFIGRGAGLAQSGEQQKLNRDNRIWSSLKTMGAVAPDGKVDFEDGSVQMPGEATGRLKNLKADPLNGNRDRSLYELDGTNPFTQRATLVARPLGMYLAQGMLGYRDKNSKVDQGAAKAAAAMFANTFADGTNNEATIFSRARQMVKKMGLKEKAVKNYFSSISKDMSIQEAEDVKRGLDILFAGDRDGVYSMREGDLVSTMTPDEFVRKDLKKK